METDQIELSLLTDFRDRLHGDTFTGASAVDAFVEIKRGVRAMVEQERTGEDDLQIARDSLQRFMNQMLVERDRGGLSEFHEETVTGAMLRMCPPPSWPWC